MTSEKSDSVIPATLLWAVRLLLLQAAGLVALIVVLIVRVLTNSDIQVPISVGLMVFAALIAATVVIVSRSLARLTPGARGPAIALQLFVIAAGGFLVQTGPAWAGLLLMALGVLVGVLIVLPASTRALGVD